MFPYIHPVIYPTASNCFLCGRFGSGDREHKVRRCHGCDTQWEVMPVSAPGGESARDSHMGQKRMMYHFRPWAAYADLFDDFIDHGQVTVASPA